MKYLKYIHLIFPIIAIALMLQPHSVEIQFKLADGSIASSFYSYFSLMPFGYADIGPLISAIGTIIILVTVIINLFLNNELLLKCEIVSYIVALSFAIYHLFLNANGYSISIAVILGLGLSILGLKYIKKATMI